MEVEATVTQATAIIHTVRPHWKDVGYLLVPLQRLCTSLCFVLIRPENLRNIIHSRVHFASGS